MVILYIDDIEATAVTEEIHSTQNLEMTVLNRTSSVTEEIHLKQNNKINRTMPTILRENGRMTLQGWNNFCNQVDDAFKPLRTTNPITNMIRIILLTFTLIFSGFSDDDSLMYGIISSILLVLLLIILWLFEKVCDESQKITSDVIKACATASNHDENLTMVPIKPGEPKTSGEICTVWCIEVTVLNNYNNGEDIVATPVAVDVATINVPIMASAPTLPSLT